MDPLAEMISLQLELQVNSYADDGHSRSRQYGDPRLLEGEDLADFIMWNAYALEDELHEALNEIRWKPWVTEGRGEWVDRDAFVKELVDAWHFFMNLLLASGAFADTARATCEAMTPQMLADELYRRYLVKRETNAKRQAEGYTGEKDAEGRELDDLERPPPMYYVENGEAVVDTAPTWKVNHAEQLQGIIRAAQHSYDRSGVKQRVEFHDGSQRDTIIIPDDRQ